MHGISMRTITRTATHAWVAGAALGCSGDAAGPSAGGDGAADARRATYSGWSVAQSVELASPGAHHSFNTGAAEGCPLTSRDGKKFFIASNRDGGRGLLDIWVSSRARTDDPWGPPVNAGEPVNSEFNDFCPMLARDGHTFYFVSNRPGGCGGTDIYVTRFRGNGSIDEPRNLGCHVNSPADEAGPVPVNEPGRGRVLYFSSVRAGGFAPDAPGAPGAPNGDSDLYSSEWHGGAFQARTLVPGVNSASSDGQPYIRSDALELFFYSNRPGAEGSDIYVATRGSAHAPWSTPVNLGPDVNSPAADTRPSLSADGMTLYFGSTIATGEGASDVYASTRQRLSGGKH